MENFENVCAEVEQSIDKIQILKKFLGKSCTNWYDSMLIKHTLQSNWEIWRKSFCDTYTNKGWTPVRHAFEYKYINSSLLDYATKKEKLLLEINKSLDKSTVIDLIAIGLPNHISDKIDRSEQKNIEDLFNAIRGLEHLAERTKPFIKNNIGKNSTENRMRNVEEKKPCGICEKEGKESARYHP